MFPLLQEWQADRQMKPVTFPSSSMCFSRRLGSPSYTDSTCPLLAESRTAWRGKRPNKPNQTPVWRPEIRSRLLAWLAGTQCALSSMNHYNMMFCYRTEKMSGRKTIRTWTIRANWRQDLKSKRSFPFSKCDIFSLHVSYVKVPVLLSVSRRHSARGICTLQAHEYIDTGI